MEMNYVINSQLSLFKFYMIDRNWFPLLHIQMFTSGQCQKG